MNPKNLFSKVTSVLASLVLAIGGSLLATQPTFAVDRTTASFATPLQSGMGSISISISGCSINAFASPTPTPQTSDFTVTINGSPATIAAVNLGSFIALSLNSTLSSGQTVVVAYTKSGTAGNQIPCTTAGDVVGSFSGLSSSVASGGGGGGGGGVTYTNTNAATFSMASGVATYTAGTWTASDSSTPSISFLWLFCDSTHNSATGSNGQSSPPSDCGPIAATDISGTSANGAAWIRTSTLSIPATAYKWVSSNGGIVTVSSATLNTKHIAVYESAGSTWKMSATSAVTETSGGSGNITAQVTRSIPTPVFQAPILNSLAPKLTGGFSSNGGRLVLKDVKPADITSVMLNGKKVDIVASKSGAALRIPAGAGAGDLQFTMADGTVINVANAVKITQSQVDPKLVDLNPLPTFKAGSVVVPAAIKTVLNKNKAIILDSESAKCVGYASSNTAAARATALTRASNVCGIITDINENIEPIIKVVVNKTVAKKTPVKYQTW